MRIPKVTTVVRRGCDRRCRIFVFSHGTCVQPKTSPNSLEPSTTVLSPYLKLGCLSPRLFYHELRKVVMLISAFSEASGLECDGLGLIMSLI